MKHYLNFNQFIDKYKKDITNSENRIKIELFNRAFLLNSSFGNRITTSGDNQFF